jgi:hypothetical protein
VDISSQIADENGILHPELTMDGLHPSLAGTRLGEEPDADPGRTSRAEVNIDMAPPPTGDPSGLKALAPQRSPTNPPK